MLNDFVLLFAMAVSIVTGIAFGLAPALRAASGDLLGSLKDAARGTAGRGRVLRPALVVGRQAWRAPPCVPDPAFRARNLKPSARRLAPKNVA